MFPAFTLKAPLSQALSKLDAIINPIIIIKQCWQADDICCSETTHRPVV